VVYGRSFRYLLHRSREPKLNCEHNEFKCTKVLEVTQPVEFGPRANAAAAYLQTYQLLPYDLTAETLDDLFGVCPSEGTLASAQATAYTRLEPVE